jgi:hypothetical protein
MMGWYTLLCTKGVDIGSLIKERYIPTPCCMIHDFGNLPGGIKIRKEKKRGE